jgi:hypothetical protein
MKITVYGLKTNKKAVLTGRKTEKAYLATVYTIGKYNGGEDLWLPKSQVKIDTVGDTIDVSQWYFSNVLDGKVFID